MTDFDWDTISDDDVKPADSNVLPPRTTRSSSADGTRRRGRPAAKRMSGLKTSLSGQMFQAGAIIGLGMPVTGYYIGQESANFTSAIVDLASKRTEWIEALEHIADIGPGIVVGRTVLGIGCAMGTDRYHRTNGESGISPDKRAAMFLGVTAAYEAVHGENGNAAEGSGFVPPPHGSFVPVS
jgi:hypothetical protein